MSIFDNKRLTNETFKLDIERMRRGWYSDKYFENITDAHRPGVRRICIFRSVSQSAANVSPEDIAVAILK
jgi:nicotinate phosphoribosyltransferase